MFRASLKVFERLEEINMTGGGGEWRGEGGGTIRLKSPPKNVNVHLRSIDQKVSFFASFV